MTTTINLEAVHAEAKRKFEPVVIELADGSTVALKPMSRLGSQARKATLAAFDEIRDIDESDDDDDEILDEYADKVCNAVAKVIQRIASSPRKLLTELDAEEDPRIRADLYTSVLRRWSGE